MLDTFSNLFNEPWFGLALSTALAIYSIILTVRTASRQHLSYLTTEGSVLEPAHPSWKDELKIIYKDSEIPRLTAARIGVWNSGNSTINGSQVVDDDRLRFEVSDDYKILKLQLVSMSRDVIKASMDRIDDRRVAIKFDFVDPGDGFVLFIAHTSPPNDIRSAGTVRGLTWGATPWTKQNAYRLMVASNVLAGPALVVMLYLVIYAIRRVLVVAEGSRLSLVLTITFCFFTILSLVFSKNVSRAANLLVLRRVPKVISEDEALRFRLMTPF